MTGSSCRGLNVPSTRADEVLDILGIHHNIIFAAALPSANRRRQLQYHHTYGNPKPSVQHQQADAPSRSARLAAVSLLDDNILVKGYNMVLKKVGDPAFLPPPAASPSTTKEKNKSADLTSNDYYIPSSLSFIQSLPAAGEAENMNSSELKKLNVVLVVVTASSPEVSLRAPNWALENLVQSGDVLVLLNVLTDNNQLTSTFNIASHLLGYKLKANAKSTSKASKRKVQDKTTRKRKEIEMIFSQFYKECKEKEVKFCLDVKHGKIKAVAIEHATTLGATYVVLDRDLKIYKKHFLEHLPCKIIQMRRKKQPSTLQGIQSTGAAKANDDNVPSNCTSSFPRFSISRTFSPRVSISQNTELENNELNDSDFFSIEFGKQADLLRFNRELINVECGSEMPDGTIIENAASVELKGCVQETWIARLPLTSIGDHVLQAANYSKMASANGRAGTLARRSDATCSDVSQMTETTESPFSALQVLNSPMDCSFLETGRHTSRHDPNNLFLSNPFASTTTTTTSRTSSINSRSVACNSSESQYASASSNYSLETAPHRLQTLSNLKELVDISSATYIKHLGSNLAFQNNAVSNYPPMDIQENVKVISVQPREVAASHFLRNLVNPDQRLASDYYSLFSQQQQEVVAASGLGKLYPAQAIMDSAVEDMTGSEEEASRIMGTILNVDATTTLSLQHSLRSSNGTFFIESHAFNGARPSILLNKENRIFTSGPFLCSVCKQVSPDFVKRPLRFSHAQLQFATDNFSSDNLLGEDELGLVYKGVWMEGQFIAIKKIKQPSLQGDLQDCRLQIELLGCAQHRNLVILLGYCDEENHFMLVYEYVCNKSLNWHLAKENNPNGLEWRARQKIAVGVARGLRYLHEECRVGCIVHQDMKANNILLTHDFQPMVGNFGLAWSQQTKDDSTESTQVVQNQGYLAPECARSHTVSWKSDVFAFGVVLLELITGRKAVDSSLEPGQHNLVEWARPLLLERKYHELLDPRLENSHDSFDLVCMVRAASLCITGDLFSRPRMSQVLHVLEGESGRDDSDLELEDSENLSVVQLDLESKLSQKKASDPTPQSHQHVISSSKPSSRRKFKGAKLTYDEMLQ